MTPLAAPPAGPPAAAPSWAATPPGRGPLAWVRRAPLASFVVLTLLFSWGPGLLLLVGVPSTPLFAPGPFLAAVVVLAVTGGRTGVGGLLRSMVRWRVPARAYVLAFGLPVLLAGVSLVINVALGAPRPTVADWSLLSELPLVFLLVLLVPAMGGTWEEPGFRGFALGRLEQRYGAVAGPVVLGVLWAVWHFPMFLSGQQRWTDVVQIIAASVVIAAVFHVGRESVLVVMVLHAMNNTIGGEFATQVFSGADQDRLALLTAVVWTLVAVGVLARQKMRGTRTNTPAAPAAPTPPRVPTA